MYFRNIKNNYTTMIRLRNFLATLALTLSALLVTSCGEKKTATYSDHVEGFTSGVISRSTPAYLILSSEVDAKKQSDYPASEMLSIEPKVDGTFSFADGRTVVFSPKNGFARNTEYTIKADLSEWFNTENSADIFEFRFKTMPLNISARLTSMKETENNKYQFAFDVQTSDNEDGTIVEKYVMLSENCDHSWSHLPDGRRHELIINTDSKSSKRVFNISTSGDDSYGLKAGTLTHVDIPSSTDMSVYNVSYVQGDQRCIEVTFTKNLDPNQKMMGLAYIDKNTSRSVDVKGNRIILYPDASARGEVTINLSSAIRSASGVALGEDKTYSVTLESARPDVKFVTEGVVVPLSGEVSIPFKAIMMRGIHVDIYRVYQNNFGTILQFGGTPESFENVRSTARPEISTTIMLDEDGSANLESWKTYAINLSDLIKVNPGDMYRIELSLDYKLSAWPDPSMPRPTRDEIEADDRARLERLSDMANEGGYFYSDYYNWEDYDWEERENPATPSFYANKRCTKNVFATNIGLTVMQGTQCKYNIIATDLTSATALSGIEIEGFNTQNQVVAKGSTDSNGEVILETTKVKGTIHHIIAKKGTDVSCLLLGSPISTSNFDVSGSSVDNGLKGFIYGERGVWRPGDTLHIGFMLSDRMHTLPENHPVSLEVTNALGQTMYKSTRTNAKMGLYAFNVPTSPDAQTGAWRAVVSVGGTRFSKNLRIETIKPNRLKIDLNLPKSFQTGKMNTASLHTEWLSGARAGNLKYEVEANYQTTKTTFKGYEGYVFDDPTRDFFSEQQLLTEGYVNGDGDATVSFYSNEIQDAPGMLQMQLSTRVYEESGEFSIDAASTLFSPYSKYVGVQAPKTDDYYTTDKDYIYNVVALNSNGTPASNENLEVRIFKTAWYWWWNSSTSDLANFMNYSYYDPKKKISLTTDANGSTSFKLNIEKKEWGTYLICIVDKQSNHRTSILSYFDWPSMYGKRSFDGRDAASILSITTDKKEYNVGDDIMVSFPSSAGSRAIVSVCNGSSILSTTYHNCNDASTTVKVKATSDMLPNVYIQVSEIQPYEQTKNDMPIRLFGITPVTVSSANSTLTPTISMKDEIRPETTVEVTVAEKDNRPMAYTLAIVDEGLLDITRFKTPNGWSTFNAREALGVNTWDIYSIVAGAFGGRIEQLFSIGGDDFLAKGPKAIVNRFTPMVHFEGPFLLNGDKKKHKVNIPNYNGRVRVMVVAGDGSAYGSAEKSVKVTKPIMIIPTMPRQVGVNDVATVSATIFSDSSVSGDVKVELEVEGAEIVGDSKVNISMGPNESKTVSFRIKVPDEAKDCIVTISAKGSGDKAEVSTKLNVRRVTQKVTKSETFSVEPGQKTEKSLSGDNVMAEISAFEPFNIAPRINELIEYPHGCGEQITSAALPQLYLTQFTELTDEQIKETEANVKSVISRLASYRTSEGAISYWPNTNKPDLWVSAYVYLFLTEAEAHGYYVDADMTRSLRKYLTSKVKTWSSKLKSYVTSDYAYVLFALANSNNAEMGTMNRMKEQLSSLSSESTLNLAAAYALVGHNDVAKELVGLTKSEGNTMRLVTLSKIGDGEDKMDADLIRKRLISDSWMSTRDCANSLYAMSKYLQAHPAAKEMKFSVNVNSKNVASPRTEKMFWSSTIANEIKDKPVVIKNEGASSLNVRLVSVTDVSQSDVQANSNGLSVAVNYDAADVAHLPQGKTFKAVVTVRNTTSRSVENIALTHILPAGWEILKADGSSIVSYQDVRDDRVLSYIDRLDSSSQATVTLYLSATYAGSYYMPSVMAEAMYDNTISGCTESGAVVVGE